VTENYASNSGNPSFKSQVVKAIILTDLISLHPTVPPGKCQDKTSPFKFLSNYSVINMAFKVQTPKMSLNKPRNLNVFTRYPIHYVFTESF
jgi:hypothetical protein